MNNMRNKILSLLVLLLTAATGAWADETPIITIENGGENTNFTSGSKTFDDKVTISFSGSVYNDGDTAGWFTDGSDKTLTVTAAEGCTITSCKFYTFSGTAVNGYTIEGESPTVYLCEGCVYTGANFSGSCIGWYGINKIEVFGTAPPSVTVDWNTTTNTGTFEMPASNVLLTPIYSEATIYEADGETEKASYATFKEAFDAVQDGEIIKLDYNVTVTTTTDLSTGNRATEDPVTFTIDFNGFVLDGSGAATTFMDTQHDGDQITFIDSSEGQTGGLKGALIGTANSFVFESGRYSFGGLTVAEIKDIWSTLRVLGYTLPAGKDFVDIENAPDANGFMVYVDFAGYELTIDAGKYATFYADKNTKLADETPAGVALYTINSSGFNADRTTVTPTGLNGEVISADMPVLVYNGTDSELTVTLKVTSQLGSSQMWSQHFKGTAEDLEFTTADMNTNDYYVLNGEAFVWVKNPGTIAANRCWLQFQKDNAARMIKIVFADATSLSEELRVKSEEFAPAQWYDLNGRKIAAPTKKGVYIKDGKKAVIK